jgi:hypothetical protein
MSVRKRFLAALLAACASGGACVATLIEPQWFELLFDESPDGGDGSIETMVAVVVSFGACLVFARLARRELRTRQRDAKPSAQVRARR